MFLISLQHVSNGTSKTGGPNAKLPSSNINQIRKTHYLADLRKLTNTDVCLAGWVHEKRAGTEDLSITLRDSTGLFEINFEESLGSNTVPKSTWNNIAVDEG